MGGYIVEAVNYGDYFLANHSSYDLRIEAANRALLKDKVLSGETVHFFDMVEGSGGHVFPSNAFSKFKLFAEIDGTERLVYSGVKNEDWEEIGFTKSGHQIIRLTVTDEFLNLPTSSQTSSVRLSSWR